MRAKSAIINPGIGVDSSICFFTFSTNFRESFDRALTGDVNDIMIRMAVVMIVPMRIVFFILSFILHD